MQVTITPPDWATHILSDLTDWDRNPKPVDGTPEVYELPDDAYFEYAFLDADGKQRPDPDNDTVAENPWYPAARALTGPDYHPDPYFRVDNIEEGDTQRHKLDSEVLDQTRRLVFYTPRGVEQTPLPIVYVQDGTAYHRLAKLAQVAQKLIDDGLIAPAHFVFIEPKDRTAEYVYNPDYRRFMTDEVLPFAEDRLVTNQQRIAMGASLGGLISATLAWKNPDLFRTVVAQSGAFLGTPEQPDFYGSEASWWLEHLRTTPTQPLRVYLEVGTLEWLTGVNRDIASVLADQGYDCAYTERSAGHNWVNWRNGFRTALQFALPV